jgi:hypothetical protein
VDVMYAWHCLIWKSRGSPPSGKVFQLSADQSRHRLKQAVSEVLKVPEAEIGLHSLRAGAATDADESGWSLSEIMFMGRWRSPTVLVYLRSGQRMAHDLGLSWQAGSQQRPTMFS